ncbi:MAG: LysM domain-containing protein [Chloroflexota bacterium]
MRRLILWTAFLFSLLLSTTGGWLPRDGFYALAGAGGKGDAPSLNDLHAANPFQIAPTNPPVIQPVITATPNPDGSVIHKVESGQSLWSIAIAYGVTIAQILEWNGLAQDAVLLAGETLVVRPSSTPTISPTPSLTPVPPTRTPSPTPTPFTPTLTYTATAVPTETPAPLIDWQPPAWLNENTLGMGLIIISAAGLVFVLLSAFRKK